MKHEAQKTTKEEGEHSKQHENNSDYAFARIRIEIFVRLSLLIVNFSSTGAAFFKDISRKYLFNLISE